jgi:HSP20 family protein
MAERRQMARWRPTTEMERFRRDMDTLFERFARDPFGAVASRFGAVVVPDVDVSETESEIVVRTELPGVDPKDVDISVAGDVLTIRGEKKVSEEEKKENFHLIEREWGAFSRSILLPQHVQPEKVQAHYKDGVLKIVLPKAEAAKARKIQVRTG